MPKRLTSQRPKQLASQRADKNSSQPLDSQVNYWTTKSSSKRAQVQGPFNNPRRPSSCRTLEEESDFPYKYNPTSSFTKERGEEDTEKFSQETSRSKQ